MNDIAQKQFNSAMDDIRNEYDEFYFIYFLTEYMNENGYAVVEMERDDEDED